MNRTFTRSAYQLNITTTNQLFSSLEKGSGINKHPVDFFYANVIGIVPIPAPSGRSDERRKFDLKNITFTMTKRPARSFAQNQSDEI